MPYLGNIPASAFSSLSYQDFTGGTGTSFTLDHSVSSAQDIEVFVNNVRQEPGVAYTVAGTALTMTGSIVATDDFYVVFQAKTFSTVSHPAGNSLQATSGTFSGGVTMGGTLGVTGAATLSSTLGVTGKITSTAGITFGSDTAAANVLDDYEEGTWVPVFADDTTGGNVSSTAATYANYVKIGSFVHVNCRFTNISTSGLTSTNAAWVTGFPFVSNSESVGSVWRQNVTSATDLVGRLGESVSAMRFDRLRSNDTDVTLSVLTFTNNVADFAFSLTYTTDA